MKPILQWPLWQRVIFANAVAVIGVYIGFATSGVKPSINPRVYTTVYTIALIDLMFLVVAPRMRAQRIAGMPTPNPWNVTYQVLAERPFTVALLILQLNGVSQATATTIVMMQTSASDYVRSLPNAHSMAQRLIGASLIMGGVAILWLLGAIGLWRSRPWAWWLVLVLNGLAATVGVILQILKPDKFSVDVQATAAVVLLFLRAVRLEFRGGQAPIKQIAD